MTHQARSVRNVTIRLPDERWTHIVEEHCELAGMRHDVMETIAAPERVLSGNRGECLSVRSLGAGKWIVVVYREMNGEGFVITAFLTKRIRSLDRRRQLWP